MLTERTIAPLETKRIDLVLRVAMFGEFLGHGVFAWQKKQKFVDMLTAMTGIKGAMAGQLIQAVGAIDIAVAFLILVKPIRIVLAWGALWALGTAIARPVSGDPIWDFVERLANVGVPLALLYVRGWPKTAKEWLS